MSAADNTTRLRTADEVLAEAVSGFDFMRCGKCGRLMTKPEIQKAIGPNGDGRACPCGSLKYMPVNLVWYDWSKPRVLAFAYRRLRGRA